MIKKKLLLFSRYYLYVIPLGLHGSTASGALLAAKSPIEYDFFVSYVTSFAVADTNVNSPSINKHETTKVTDL